jgi:8-oxo-dGTP pyrophosphatase MutT (NUDIX family)
VRVDSTVPADRRHVTGRLGLAERARLVRPVPGLEAAVAVPVLRHPRGGMTILVSIRPRINGHTGRPMSHAGETVLLGGALEPGESPVEAALRELREESGTADRLTDADFSVVSSLGRWVTESGYVAHGFLVAAPAALATARPDPREVEALVHLPVSAVYAARVRLAYHAVPADDRAGVAAPAGGGDWLFESPTLRVSALDGGSHLLWGLAGHMIARMRQDFPGTEHLAAALRNT